MERACWQVTASSRAEGGAPVRHVSHRVPELFAAMQEELVRPTPADQKARKAG